MLDIEDVRKDASPSVRAVYPLAWAWLVRQLCDPFTVTSERFARRVVQGERLTFTKPARVSVVGGGSAGMIPVGPSIPALEGSYAKVWEWSEPTATIEYTVTEGVDLSQVDKDSDAYMLLCAAMNWVLDYVMRLSPADRGVTWTSIEGFSESISNDMSGLAGFGPLLDGLLDVWGACGGKSASGYLAFSDFDGNTDRFPGLDWYDVLYPRTRG